MKPPGAGMKRPLTMEPYPGAGVEVEVEVEEVLLLLSRDDACERCCLD